LDEDVMIFDWVRAGVVTLAVYGTLLAISRAQAAEPLPGETFRDCESCSEMVVIPSGDFVMGATLKASESPPHPVKISKAFAIGRKEVTFAEWDECVKAGGCNYTPPDQGWGRGDRPAINLSWDDSKQYIAWISKQTGKAYRLPAEAEWEYAARAGSTTPYWWGKDAGSGHAKCVDCGEKTPGTAPAGSFRPNAFGVYDTSGNAAEWVEDCWNPSFKGAPANGAAWTTGDCSLRVLRGGSFLDKAPGVSSSARFRYDNDVRYYANGFRLARDLE
jgi:formylglycine-generating enzyme required for sulfatase activity